MKKVCLLICSALILQMLCSCAAKKEDYLVPTQFYYGTKEITYHSPTGVIQAETREGAEYQGNLDAFLRAYLQGPVSTQLQLIIPSDTSLVSYETDGSTICIVMSAQLSKLSGISLLTACSALFLSLHDFSGIETLRVSAEGCQLDEKDEIVITMDDIVLMDMVNIEE